MRTSPAVDIERVLQLLRTPAMLPVRSDRDMASKVKVIAEKKRLPEGTFSYLKAPEPVAVGWSPLKTSPADILRELGVATTFVSRSRFLPVAQLWAHVRYCATMRKGRNQMLELLLVAWWLLTVALPIMSARGRYRGAGAWRCWSAAGFQPV